MAKPIRRKYLDFEGLCQLTWVGRLISVPGPKENIVFRAYFTKVMPSPDGENQFKRFGEAFWRDFPVGDIMDVPIGTMFYQGEPVKRNVDDALSVRKGFHALDFSEGNVRIIDRWARVGSVEDPSSPGKLLLPRAPGSLPNDPNYNGTLLCVGENGDPFAYVIPSYEIFRFFYAVSSRMAQVFLDSRFLEWGRYVWNPDRSSIDHDRREALLWLRQWMLDQDAWFIASLAFDPIAVNRGMDLYRSIAVDRNRILRAVPPMTGLVNFIARWVPIKNNAGTTSKVILQFVNTDWHPPFDRLRYDRDNDGRKAENEDGSEKELLYRPPTHLPKPTSSDEEDTHLDLTDIPANPKLPLELAPVAEINDRFEWLMTTDIDKLPQLETLYEGEKYVELLNERWTNLLSTINGTTSSDAIQSVVLTAKDLALISTGNADDDELEDPNEPIHTPDNDLLTIARGLADINKHTDATVKFLTLWGPAISIETFTLYRLPKTIKGEVLSWLCNAKSKKTRLALAAKIVRPNDSALGYETRYVLDFERNPNNSNIVILWTNSDRELSEHDLRRLVYGFAQERSVMKDLSRAEDLLMGHRRHTKHSDFRDGAPLLERIFSTPPTS